EGGSMRHRPLFIAVVWIGVFSAVSPASPATAQAITDLTYELAALSEPELLVDWTAAGLGTRTGIRVTSVGNTRTYTHSSLSLDNGEAFLMDTVFSGAAMGAAGERGARMWVRFRDATLPPGMYWIVEARFFEDGGGSRWVHLVDGSSGSVIGALSQDWTEVSPRLRVRIRHQNVAGVPTIFFMAENSTQWTPDLSGPLTPDATNTLSIPLSLFSPAFSGPGEFGFGNVVAGTYYTDVETVRLIRSSESDTVLPALLAVDVPSLGVPGFAVLVMLFAIGGWVLLVRFRS
ncbi:MAG: hypothetical protein OQK55_08285, partial [Thermoanaerobaculales bacterium]|nr:hypothetical protein [Thermoanaerobaculales bacterium]